MILAYILKIVFVIEARFKVHFTNIFALYFICKMPKFRRKLSLLRGI